MEESYAARVGSGPRRGHGDATFHVTVNGWYFHAPNGSGPVWKTVFGMLRQPRIMWAALQTSRPEIGDRLAWGPEIARWSERPPAALPLARRAVRRRRGERGRRRAVRDHRRRSRAIAGDYLQSISMIAGNAWKVEGVLAGFYARHLRPALGGSHQTLVSGLEQPRPLQPYSIQSLDWFRPTFGELGMASAGPPRALRAGRGAASGPKRRAAPSSTASSSPGSTDCSPSPRSTPASARSRSRT